MLVNSIQLALNPLKKLLKSLVGAVGALSLTVIPVDAKVDNGTYELLETVEQLGFSVYVNSAKCTEGNAGLFIPSDKSIHICKDKGRASADDHDTVRHEVWHIIQYCGTSETATALQPYTQDKETYIERINDSLTDGQIDHVIDSYPDHVEIVELEAFAAAQALSAAEIQDILVKTCPAPHRFSR